MTARTSCSTSCATRTTTTSTAASAIPGQAGFDDVSTTLCRMRVGPSDEVTIEDLWPRRLRVPAARLAPHEPAAPLHVHGGPGRPRRRPARRSTRSSRSTTSSGATTMHDSATGRSRRADLRAALRGQRPRTTAGCCRSSTRRAEHRSRLVVLDARDVESEPVAVAHLRHHVPLGFHGTFTSRVAHDRRGAQPQPFSSTSRRPNAERGEGPWFGPAAAGFGVSRRTGAGSGKTRRKCVRAIRGGDGCTWCRSGPLRG